MEKTPLLQTGVDKLVSLIKEKKRVSVPQAAKELGVSQVVVEEWADFLEEDDIISIEYRLATPWLVDKKLKREEVAKKVKEFHDKKDILIRKSESLLGFLNKEGDEITKIRNEFKNLKDEIQNEASSVKNEIRELERFDELKKKIDGQIKEQENSFKSKIQGIDGQVSRMQKRYSELLGRIGDEEKVISAEKLKAESIKRVEDELKGKIKKIEESIINIKKKVKDEDVYIEDMENHIKHLRNLASETKNIIRLQNNNLKPLADESLEYKRKVEKIQKDVLKKVYKNTKKIRDDIKESERLSEKFKDFFNKKIETINLVDKINQDRNDIKKELDQFIARANAFSASSKSADIQKEILIMEKKFREIDRKKSVFEKEIGMLCSLVRKKGR